MKTRLMVLMSDAVGKAEVVPYNTALRLCVGLNFRGAFRVPSKAARLLGKWWEAETEAAALRAARAWLREVGAEEVT